MQPLRPHGRFALLIVGGEKARPLLEQAADDSDLFWSIRSMADGRFALEHIWACLGKSTRRGLPDIVITDVQVSGLNGIQLTRELRRHEEISPMYVAVLASSPTPEDQDAAETAGCDYFIRRPDTLETLAAALKSIAQACQAKATVPAKMLC